MPPVEVEYAANLKTNRPRAFAERLLLGVLIELASFWPEVAAEFLQLVNTNAVEGYERRRLFEEIPRALTRGPINLLEEDLVEAIAIRAGGTVHRDELRLTIVDALNQRRM